MTYNSNYRTSNSNRTDKYRMLHTTIITLVSIIITYFVTENFDDHYIYTYIFTNTK